MAAVSVGEGHLDGGREVEEEARGASASRVGGVLLESDGRIDKVRLAIAVQVSNLDGPGDVGSEIGQLRVSEGSLSGGLLVTYVFEVAVHDSDGVDVAATANVSDGKIFGQDDTHVDDVCVGLVGSVGVGGRVVLELAVVFDDGNVIVVSGIGGLARGVIQTFAAQQEDIIVSTGAGQSALRLAVIANFNRAVGVLLRRTQGGWNTVGG